jgi:D-alanyl-D-alanine carboxypeptidase/D-alanyl-D-alanine-endopeptidase (penicillin-binding protein 4)
MSKKIALFFPILLFTSICLGQTTAQKLAKAFQQLQQDKQAESALSSVCVLDAQSGEVIFASNEHIGLATASTLKTITSATAFYLLGVDFSYDTQLAYTGQINSDGVLNGDIYIIGAGDPSLGSSRYEQNNADRLLKNWTEAVKKLGIKKINGQIIADDSAFGSASVPTGWIWQDIGNYYGAGGNSLCWQENQFDIKLKPGSKAGDSVQILAVDSIYPRLKIVNELKTGTIGSGDQAYAFLAPYTQIAYLRGTWGLGIAKNGISLSNPDPASHLAHLFSKYLNHQGLSSTKPSTSSRLLNTEKSTQSAHKNIFYHSYSPTLAQIIYWFNKKSINLYGEQLLKTIAQKQGLSPSTENGAQALIDFWTARGIKQSALNVKDGSGLSPANRVSTYAMAQILYQAQKEPWFASYIRSFPEYNGMTLKSGNINDVTAYTGYYTNAAGKKYIAVININNYTGNRISNKLFQVLNQLK